MNSSASRFCAFNAPMRRARAKRKRFMKEKFSSNTLFPRRFDQRISVEVPIVVITTVESWGGWVDVSSIFGYFFKRIPIS